MARKRTLQIDLDQLPPHVRSAIEAAVAGHRVTVTRSGTALGSLEFRGLVQDGAILPVSTAPVTPNRQSDGVTVVVTAMELSDAARAKVAEELSEGFVVLDLADAPPTADVLLVPPASPQLIAALRSQFERARIVIVEIDDDEAGVHYSGPVARMLAAGASAYLPPRSISEVSSAVRQHLANGTTPEIERALRHPNELPPSE
ncbi:hypothetical protein GCM10009590_28470 [Brachybacterium alimentarium]